MFRFKRATAAWPAACLMLAAASVPMQSASALDLMPSIWTGMYAGMHLGADWASLNLSDDPYEAHLNSTSAQLGGHAGFGADLSGVYLGIEADLNYNFARYNLGTTEVATVLGWATATDTLDPRAEGSVRARLGVPAGPLLIYGTLGYAWRNYEWRTDASLNSAPVAFSASQSETLSGLVYGGGVEGFAGSGLTLRLEALHYGFGGSSTLADYGVSSDVDSTVVRLGASWRFN